MNENIKQPITQERNLALEQKEAGERLDASFVRQKELRIKGGAETFEKEGKKFLRFKDKDSEEYKEYMQNREQELKDLETSINIYDYKKLATSREQIASYKTGETSNFEKLKQEKERVGQEVEKTKVDIESTTKKLNELRKKLELQETDDIPSLVDKKTKLEYLYGIQSDLENKLNFGIKKAEAQKKEEGENKKIEVNNIKGAFENMSSDLKKVASILEERKSEGYHSIFNDEEGFRSVASDVENFSDQEEMLENLRKIGGIVDNFADNRGKGINDDKDSLYEMTSKLRQLATSISELPSKIKDEEERKKIALVSNPIAEKVNSAAGRVSQKAQAIEAYLNMKM